MMLIPTPDGYPHVFGEVTLSGASYALVWIWNERDRAWYFSMDDPSGDPLVQGVRVALRANLLAWAPAGRRPPYPIYVSDPTQKGLEPTLETLGSTIQVVYLEPDE